MNQSEQINELASALIKVQANLKPAERDGENPHFQYNYATLASVWEVCRKPLSDNGIAVIQTPTSETLDAVTVQTKLVHSSGQWISGSLSMKPQKNDPQSIGSIVSYFRRYLLASMVGICVEDDDAEGAMDRKEAPKTNGKPYNGFPKTDNPDTSSGKDGFISEAQGKRLYAIYKAKGLSDNEMKQYLFDKFGIKTSKEISRRNYESIVEWVNNFNRIENADDILQEDVFPGVND